ncbi:hypothetical protein ABKN59_011894 [Abortiporus biennis]
MKTLLHHRIVQELEFPLLRVPSSKNVVRIIRDAAKIIIAVFGSKSKRLHRDVSVLNIMTVQIDGILRGILNDWDHSKKMLPGTDSKAYRTGTWLFISILLAKQEPKVHSMLDDLESCLWVLLYVALHRFKHSADRVALRMFEEMDNNQCGGDRKFLFILAPAMSHLRPDSKHIIFECKPLNNLVESIRLYFRKFHTYRVNLGPDDDPDALETHMLAHPEEFLAMFDDALAADGWIENDAVGDNFPPLNNNDKGKQAAETEAKKRVQTANSKLVDVVLPKQAPKHEGPRAPSSSGTSHAENIVEPPPAPQPKRTTRASSKRTKPVPPPSPPPSNPPLPRYNTRLASKRALEDNHDQNETGRASKRQNTNSRPRAARKPKPLPELEARPQKKNLRRIKSQGDVLVNGVDNRVFGRKKKE